MEMPKLAVEFVPTRALEAYENNAKIHTKEQVRQICNSIEQFGFNDPIAVWGDEIVEGHGRVMAALELGIERVPVIRLDHLTDEQRRAYTHVHNQLTMNTGWDIDALYDELANLNFEFDDLGFDMEKMVGFNAIDDLMTEDFSKNTTENSGNTCYFSVVFDISERDSVLPWFRKVGNEFVADWVREQVRNWQE